jgi:deoxyribonuclease V
MDVQYDDATGTALAALVLFNDWVDSTPAHEITAHIDSVEPYVPGSFYKRELPCLHAVLKKVWDVAWYDVLVVDGHTWLQTGRPGLGHYLHESTGMPVVGIAKRHFVDGCATPVTRGQSKNPLYVSTVGCDPHTACEDLRRMHGDHRIPTLLKRVDRLARGG